MSPTKQAKSQGDSGKEPIHQVIEWGKKAWENPDSVGGQFSSGQRRNSDYKTNWIETLRELRETLKKH